jgi:hypothetical protein
MTGAGAARMHLRCLAGREQRMKVLFALILVAWPCWAQSYVPPVDPEAACGASDVKFQVKSDYQGQHLPEVAAGKAVIYFVQTQKIAAINHITAKIGLDGAWVGANQGDSYFFVTVNPGEHHLCARWQSNFASLRAVSLNSLTAESGKTYYFLVRITGDGRAADSFDLVKLNSDEAQLLIARSPFSVSRATK